MQPAPRDEGKGGTAMKIIKCADGMMRIKIEDTDSYEVTEDNGVNFWPTKRQVRSIIRVQLQMEAQR